ncbi:MAG: hypothetical protein V4489_07495 [Chlamydiota bacterium]
MCFEVKASMLKKDEMGKYKYDSGSTFTSDGNIGSEALKITMFRFFKDRVAEKNYGVIEEFFHQPEIKLEKAFLEYEDLDLPGLLFRVEVKGGAVSTWKGEDLDRSFEKTSKKIKRLSNSEALKNGEFISRVFFDAREGKCCHRDSMLSPIFNSTFSYVKTHSEYMDRTKIYTIAPSDAIVNECKKEIFID